VQHIHYECVEMRPWEVLVSFPYTWQSGNETMEVLVSFPDHLYGPHKVSAIGSNYYAYIEAHF